MNRNALTEQRRETVIGLLKGMNIKKSAGEGFDKDDVYDCMQQLCDLYEKSIEDLQNSYEAELGQLRDRYQKYDENNELYVSLIMEAKKSSNEDQCSQTGKNRKKLKRSWLKVKNRSLSRKRIWNS